MTSKSAGRKAGNGDNATPQQEAEERVAELQRMVAMLLERNEELRQQLIFGAESEQL